MSTLSRIFAPEATGELAGMVRTVLSNLDGAAPQDLTQSFGAGNGTLAKEVTPAAAAGGVVFGPGGLGTSAARAFLSGAPADISPGDVSSSTVARSNGSSPSALVVPVEEATDEDSVPAIFCPGAVRDNPALGEEVNRRLIDWAEQVGIYPGQVDRLHAANFGRLMMLTHPATDDPDRLLAAARCVLAEWATDDHFLDEESMGADAERIGSRLAVTYAAIDPADLPDGYAEQLARALSEEPVAVAYRSAFEHLARYASPTQVARLRHELSVMFVAYNQEADWRKSGRIPAVWEYLTHRHENSFLPPMVLVDPIAGYELPAFEFADRRVRRLFALAGTASVILNDLYSMAKESDADFDLPKLLVIEEKCSEKEAIERTVRIHNELMHTFVAEAIVVSQVGSPALRRFLTDIWAWLGGSREWHSTTGRYNAERGT
jgi:2-methylisoborneol synthase